LISGRVLDSHNNPVQGATVSLQVNNPQNQPLLVQLEYPDQTGYYADSLILPPSSSAGTYTVFVSASKPGYNNAQAQTTFTVLAQTTTSVTLSTSTSSQTTKPPPSKCFIATATYGSELSPEVAFLRFFRDSEVLRTLAGRSFMQAFNTFYYSFSPQVASFIALHRHIRSLTKMTLYPLIGILHLASNVFTIFSFNEELAVTLSGIFASLGIGLVYFGPLATLVLKVLKPCKRFSSNLVWRITLVSGVACLGALGAAETSLFAPLLIVASVGTVLSFGAAGAFAAIRLAERLGFIDTGSSGVSDCK